MVSEDILTMIEHASSVFDDINISVEDAIQLIHNAGGKAVWAHPFCVKTLHATAMTDCIFFSGFSFLVR
mgnify:CR=1 FL=1